MPAPHNSAHQTEIVLADAHGKESLCCIPAAGHKALSAEEAGILSARFKALADPSRLRILSIIAANPGAETCVCDLPGPLNIGQPTVSHHLKILVDAGFLRREKRGVWAYYSLAAGALETLAASLVTNEKQ